MSKKNKKRKVPTRSTNKKTSAINNKTETTETTFSIHSGPFPAPEVLKSYNEIGPEFVKRIFDHAEREQEFRHNHVNELRDQEHERELSALKAQAEQQRQIARINFWNVLFQNIITFIGAVASVSYVYVILLVSAFVIPIKYGLNSESLTLAGIVLASNVAVKIFAAIFTRKDRGK